MSARNVVTVALHEVRRATRTPLAVGAGAALLALTAFLFFSLVDGFQGIQATARQQGWAALGPEGARYRNLTDGVVVQLWGSLATVLLFVTPLLSMRLFPERRPPPSPPVVGVERRRRPREHQAREQQQERSRHRLPSQSVSHRWTFELIVDKPPTAADHPPRRRSSPDFIAGQGGNQCHAHFDALSMY